MKEARTLAAIASDLKIQPAALRIEEKIAGRPAVFYEKEGITHCACAVGSAYWITIQTINSLRVTKDNQ